MGRLLIYALGGGRGHATRAGLVCQAFEAAGHQARALVREGAERWAGPGAVAIGRQGGDELAATVRAAVVDYRPDALLVDVFPGGLLDELTPQDGKLFGVPAALMLRLHNEADTEGFRALARHYALRIDLEPALQWLPPDLDALPLGPVARALPVPAEAPRIVLVPAADASLTEHLRSSIDDLLVYEEPELHWIAPHEAADLALGPGDVVVGRAGYNLTWEIAGAGARHVALPADRRWDDQQRRAQAMATVVTRPSELVAAVGRALAAGERSPVDVSGASRIVAALGRALLG
jgi:hypothetical protein